MSRPSTSYVSILPCFIDVRKAVMVTRLAGICCHDPGQSSTRPAMNLSLSFEITRPLNACVSGSGISISLLGGTYSRRLCCNSHPTYESWCNECVIATHTACQDGSLLSASFAPISCYHQWQYQWLPSVARSAAISGYHQWLPSVAIPVATVSGYHQWYDQWCDRW